MTHPIIVSECEKFEREFVIKSNAGTGLLRYTDADKIKSFLTSSLERALAEREREIVEMVKEYCQNYYNVQGYLPTGQDLKDFTINLFNTTIR